MSVKHGVSGARSRSGNEAADSAFESLSSSSGYQHDDDTVTVHPDLLNDFHTGHVAAAASASPSSHQLPQLMTVEHKDRLTSNRLALVDNMIVGDVINRLIQARVLNISERQTILKNDATDQEKVERFLDIFVRKLDNAYCELVDALEQTGQRQLAELLHDH